MGDNIQTVIQGILASLTNLAARVRRLESLPRGGGISVLTADPVAPVEDQYWLLTTTTGGMFMGVLGLTCAGGTTVQLCLYTGGVIYRMTLSSTIPAHIVNATGTLPDVTAKFNVLLADLESLGLLEDV